MDASNAAAPPPMGAKGLKRRWMEQHQRQQEELERKARAEKVGKPCTAHALRALNTCLGCCANICKQHMHNMHER